jgi:hypothetical protein
MNPIEALRRDSWMYSRIDWVLLFIGQTTIVAQRTLAPDRLVMLMNRHASE